MAIAAAAAAVLLWPAGPGASPATADGRPVGGGARLWASGRTGATILVVTRVRPGPLLTDLRNARVGGLSLVVMTNPNQREATALVPVLDRHPARHVLTSSSAAPGDIFLVGPVRIEVLAVEPRLEVRVVRLAGRG